jgi:protein FAM32A
VGALQQETEDGFILGPPPEGTDRRTAAEKRHDEKMAAREKERVAKMAAKTHRERVNEFNAYLQNLSEHHDIPKVGPG